MGTRNLTAVKIGGEYKIAQYGQWDGYPSGQGSTALQFLRYKGNRDKLKKALQHCVYVTQEEMDATMKELGIGEWMTMEEAAKLHQRFPFINRDHGADVLRMVVDAAKAKQPIKLQDSLDFASDSLFCEWAYVVDFDKGTFEVYKGFNTTPLKRGERFLKMPLAKQGKGENKYYPIKLLKSFKLAKLPKTEAFIEALNKLTKEDED
jgi:hypothetical protein